MAGAVGGIGVAVLVAVGVKVGSAGLSGMALYLPAYRVDLQQWCEWTGGDWQKIRQVVGSGFRLLGPREQAPSPKGHQANKGRQRL